MINFYNEDLNIGGVTIDTIAGDVAYNKSMDEYYTNSVTSATEGDITYNVGGDMTGAGYNAEAKNYESGTESKNASIGFGNNAVQASYNESRSSNKSMDEYYTRHLCR
jgi:hypothetical protein